MNAPLGLACGETLAATFIRRLCITLAHRWVPDRLFMLFVGRIDESNTHGPKPDIIMSAFLGTGRQWELFGRKLRGLQREYGFKILHTTDFHGQTGEFKGWSGQKCVRLVNALVDLFRTELTEGIVTHLPFDLYQTEYVAKLPPKMHRTSQYGVCFQATLERLLGATMRHKGKVALSVVMEDGHANAGDAARIFAERRERYRHKLGANALETFTLASKQDSPELMAADFLAHTFSIIGREHRQGVRGYGEMTDQLPAKSESDLPIQEVTPEYLQEWRDEFEAGKQVKHEAWLKRREAWQASHKTET